MDKAEKFAEELVRVVRADVDRDIERYGDCRSFKDLHEVCDANDFLLGVGEKFGYPVTDPDWVLGEGARIESDAIERVNAEVFDIDSVQRRAILLEPELGCDWCGIYIGNGHGWHTAGRGRVCCDCYNKEISE